MPVIEPVPWEHLDPEFQALLGAAVERNVISNALPVRQWAYRPAAAAAWVNLLVAINGHARLEPRLRELVRLRVASFTRCESCLSTRKSPDVSEDDIACLSADSDRFTGRERAALAFVDLFVADPFSISDATFEALLPHFDIEEVTELAMYSALMLAGGRLGYVLRAGADDDSEPVYRHASVKAQTVTPR